MKSFIAASAALGLSSAASAQLAQMCPESNLCYSLNVPDTTASSGKGDIFFQISAPTTYEWVALGQGSSMSGSNMFVIYTSANGNNVTVSPRLGTGHSEPQHDTSAQIAILGGTSVSNGKMVANVKCSNCNSWSGGSMDFTSGSSEWIYAYKSGSSMNSDNVGASISQHDGASSFSWSLAKAKGGDSANPFVASTGSTSGSGTSSGSNTASLPACKGAASTASQSLASPVATGSGGGGASGGGTNAGSGCPTAWPSQFSTSWPTARPTWASTCIPSGYGSWPTNAPWQESGRTNNNNQRREAGQACINEDGSISNQVAGDGSSSGDSSSASFQNAGVPFGGNIEKANRIILAHGVIASLAFVALFPIGGILIRVASFTGLIWIHAACQVVAYLFYIVAFGLGAYYASELHSFNDAHPIIGIVLFIVLFIQPLSGLLHHKLFKKHGTRTAWSYEHIGVGRIAILLGIINGGLGIRLAGDVSRGGKIAYAVCAAVMGLLYIAAIIFGEKRRRRNAPPSYDDSQKEARSLAGSDDGSPMPVAHGTVHEHYQGK